jgi:PAS domain S-box-containing protein
MTRHLITEMLVAGDAGALDGTAGAATRALLSGSGDISVRDIAFRFLGAPGEVANPAFWPDAVAGVLVRALPDTSCDDSSGQIDRALASARAGARTTFTVQPGAATVTLEPRLGANGRLRALLVAVELQRPAFDEHRPDYQRESEFRTLIENAPDIIARLDRSMRCVYVNTAVERLFGVSVQHCLQRGIDELGLPPAVAGGMRAAFGRVLAEAREQGYAFAARVRGQTHHYSARLIPECDCDSRVGSVLVITYDVTERTRVERERDALLVRERVARSQAEAAARSRDQFLSVISHELRSPLHGIQSWTHVLEHKLATVTPDRTMLRALTGIKTGIERQVRIVDDLLDATRLLAGKLRLTRRVFSLRGEVGAAVDAIRDDARSKDIEVVTDYSLVDDRVDGDPARVQQVVWNLLSNAVKFTPSGGIVTVSLSADKAGNSAQIVVSDTGKGIAPEFQPHVFQLFRQADDSNTRASDGLGLGLTLVARLTELHGGHVDVTSGGEHRGTTFTVSLPLIGTPLETSALSRGANQVSLPDLPSLSGLSVMVIDDQDEARESLSAMLAQSGARVVPAASGREAIARLTELGPQHEPDIVICDIAMPGEDGYATLRRIREWENDAGVSPARRLAAIALTAFAQREDRFRALSRGFRLHFAKPVDPLRLLGAIAALTER